MLLPLELGLSLAQTAAATRSISGRDMLAAHPLLQSGTARTRSPPIPKRALRNRAHATLKCEAQILDEVLAGAMRGGVVVVAPLKDRIAERLGKPVALSTISPVLARNGWRQAGFRTPRTRKAMRRRARTGKKTPGQAGSNRSKLGQRPTLAADVSGRSPLRTHLGHPLLLVPPPGQAARQRHGHAAIHLRLWRGESAGWRFRQPGAAAGQFGVHANLPRRDRQSPPERQRSHGAGWRGWHKCKDFHLPDNLRLLFLPPYSPELNPHEHLWDELREKHFHNRVFDSIDALEDHLVDALRDMENAPERVKSSAGWDWIINSVSIAIYATLLGENSYLGSVRTRYRLLAANGGGAASAAASSAIRPTPNPSCWPLRRIKFGRGISPKLKGPAKGRVSTST